MNDNKKTPDSLFKINDDKELNEIFQKIKDLSSSNFDTNNDFNNLTNNEFNENLTVDEYDENDTDSLQDSKYENNELNNSNKNLEDVLLSKYNLNSSSQIIELKKLSTAYFFILLIEYLIGIIIFFVYYYNFLYEKNPFAFLNAVKSDSILIALLISGFLFNLMPFIIVFPILIFIKLAKMNPKIKNRKQLKTLFILGMFTGIFSLIASGILSFGILKDVKIHLINNLNKKEKNINIKNYNSTNEKYFNSYDNQIFFNRINESIIFEQKIEKRIDEKKLNSLKSTAIAFLFFSIFALLLFFVFLVILNPVDYINKSTYFWASDFYIKLISYLSFILSSILAFVLIIKCSAISKNINYEFKVCTILYWIFLFTIILVTIFQFINFDFLLNVVINFFASIFAIVTGSMTISKVKELKTLNPQY